MRFQDDEKDDPQWSTEQILASQFRCAGVLIGRDELAIMAKTTVAVFEILEKAWSAIDCALIDMKVEFGVDKTTSRWPASSLSLCL